MPLSIAFNHFPAQKPTKEDCYYLIRVGGWQYFIMSWGEEHQSFFESDDYIDEPCEWVELPRGKRN